MLQIITAPFIKLILGAVIVAGSHSVPGVNVQGGKITTVEALQPTMTVQVTTNLVQAPLTSAQTEQPAIGEGIDAWSLQ